MNVSSEQFDEDDDETQHEETHIEWSNLIFLPFHPTFKIIVMFSVVIKCIMGPLLSVYSIVYCWDTMDTNTFLAFIKFYYMYCCDPIYCIDTFLHIVHRYLCYFLSVAIPNKMRGLCIQPQYLTKRKKWQVTDKAMRREYSPKSAFLLFIDIISVIPFFRMLVNKLCPRPVIFWPNVLSFIEFLVIYRIGEYFSLAVTHSTLNILVGFTILMICYMNCMTCFWLLLTELGLCDKCKEGVMFDWRYDIRHKLNETDQRLTTYVYGISFMITYFVNEGVDDTKPSTILEFIVVGAIVIIGFLLTMYIFIPKLFSEHLLDLRRIFTFQPHVRRIIEETHRRHCGSNVQVEVENFYSLLWKKRSGIAIMPQNIAMLPKYLRLEIKQDLVWPIFYHSPVLKKTSTSFRRRLCDSIIPDYKLPGERFFSGPNSNSNFYYLKSGIVQIISSDDNTTPILSLTSGTVFGDINFLYAPSHRSVVVRCLTYCEVLFLPRVDYIRAIYHHSEDRRVVIQAAKERLNHARTLFNCKSNVRGIDRSEDENLSWLKRRWWEISHVLTNYKKTLTKRHDKIKCQLPPEESVYHCAKYIGLLVLCHETQLHTKSLFANVRFPWILVPNSTFGTVWHRIVIVTVFCVLLLYPSMLTKDTLPSWFRIFQLWANLVYVSDIFVSLLTAVSKWEMDSFTKKFASVMFERCRTLYFVLDVVSTLWIEDLCIIIGYPEYYNISQFNRLIKIYLLFIDQFKDWNMNTNPIKSVYHRVIMIKFCYIYVVAHIVYILLKFIPNLHRSYFFGGKLCGPETPIDECDPSQDNILSAAISFLMEVTFCEYLPQSLNDVYVVAFVAYGMYLTSMYCKTFIIAATYLNLRDSMKFQIFVTNLNGYYKLNKIHDALQNRLDKYLTCHWKYYRGVDILYPRILKDEPFDIYWKVQGVAAEKIIGESLPFVGAKKALIRDLTHAAKFLILPKISTIFRFGVHSKYAVWVAKGYVKCEYHNIDGELLTLFYTVGEMLSADAVFLGKTALRTYSAYTDCEILYIHIQDFHKIIKHHKTESRNLEKAVAEYQPLYNDIFYKYMERHEDYKEKLRSRIFLSRASDSKPTASTTKHKKYFVTCKEEIINFDETQCSLLRMWLTFRATIACISIISASIQGGSGVFYRKHLVALGIFCDIVACIDILLKLFLPYYDERGILIYDRRKCVLHYLTRGFIMDIIGTFPWYKVFSMLINHIIDDNDAMLINTICKFAHLYLVLGHINYIGDTPTMRGAFIIVLKFQVAIILIMFGLSHYLMHHCVSYTFEDNFNLVNVASKNICWVSDMFNLKLNLSESDLHLLYAESLNLAQCALFRMNFGRFQINRDTLGIGWTLILMDIIYWYVLFRCVTFLMLNSRSNVLFQHGVTQLSKFLKAERVDKKIIQDAVAHFTYCWYRTNGIDISSLSNERLGVVFRQDLNYYFYQKTLTALDTLLHGGRSLGHQLASCCSQQHILPGQEIFREMDLASFIYIVHRGNVLINQNGKNIATLTRGCTFGPLNDSKPRPIRISAVAEDYVDLLEINVKLFSENLTVKVKQNITNNPLSQNDYISTAKAYVEDPYDTIRYIIRIRKAVKLPWMTKILKAYHRNWLYNWLYFVWLIEPFISTFMVLILITMPDFVINIIVWVLTILDLVHWANLYVEFYSMQIVVVNDKCVTRMKGLRLFKEWYFYIDLATLIVPLFTFMENDWRYQFIKILRLKLLHDFYTNFCKSLKSHFGPILLKLIIVVLTIHAITCGWIAVACRDKTFPIERQEYLYNDSYDSLDTSQWVRPKSRIGGCARLTTISNNDTEISVFVVPKDIQNDYVVALTHTLFIFTHTVVTTVVPLTLGQIYYKVITSFAIHVLNVWLMSLAINFMYSHLRNLYHHDYNVSSLLIYFRQSGVSPVILKAVEEYTKQLWRRQRGNWLPELAQTAPICLREDLFCALYLHHLETPTLFRNLPSYFIRQLATRFKRIVVFPGNFIVQKGDRSSAIYFIHEGEVEKWSTNKNGEDKMMALLSTNSYFGFVPALFPDIPYQFSYYSRTVVDIVYLKFSDWQDLLEGYPEIKAELYTAASLLRKELEKTYHH